MHMSKHVSQPVSWNHSLTITKRAAGHSQVARIVEEISKSQALAFPVQQSAFSFQLSDPRDILAHFETPKIFTSCVADSEVTN